jgi:hypothetical protein
MTITVTYSTNSCSWPSGVTRPHLGCRCHLEHPTRNILLLSISCNSLIVPKVQRMDYESLEKDFF